MESTAKGKAIMVSGVLSRRSSVLLVVLVSAVSITAAAGAAKEQPIVLTAGGGSTLLWSDPSDWATRATNGESFPLRTRRCRDPSPRSPSHYCGRGRKSRTGSHDLIPDRQSHGPAPVPAGLWDPSHARHS